MRMRCESTMTRNGTVWRCTRERGHAHPHEQEGASWAIWHEWAADDIPVPPDASEPQAQREVAGG